MLIDVECLLCKRVLTFERNDTKVLVKHIQSEHPNLSYTYCRKEQPKAMQDSGSSQESGPNIVLPIVDSLVNATPKQNLPQNSSITDSKVSFTMKESPEQIHSKPETIFTQYSRPRDSVKSKNKSSSNTFTTSSSSNPQFADKIVQTPFELMCPDQKKEGAAYNKFRDAGEALLKTNREKKSTNNQNTELETVKNKRNRSVKNTYEVKTELQARPPAESYYKTRSKVNIC